MWIRTTERSWWRTTETSLGVSFETYLRRGRDVLMGCRHYVSLRRRHDIPLRLCEDVPLRRLGDVPLRRRWMFHLRRTCDVTRTYKKMSLRRGHDVLLPGGVAIFNWIFHLSNFWRTFLMFFKPFQALYEKALPQTFSIWPLQKGHRFAWKSAVSENNIFKFHSDSYPLSFSKNALWLIARYAIQHREWLL